MVITIRLYPREPDLVALYKNPNFNFNAEMKSAVLAYASGEPHTIKIPPPPEDMKTMVPIDSAIVTHIYLHEEKDKDAINAIHTFRYGYINDALKILFRSYLEFPYLEPLYTESNYRLKTRARVVKGYVTVRNERKEFISSSISNGVITIQLYGEQLIGQNIKDYTIGVVIDNGITYYFTIGLKL